jgi:hypothetical protein
LPRDSFLSSSISGSISTATSWSSSEYSKAASRQFGLLSSV